MRLNPLWLAMVLACLGAGSGLAEGTRITVFAAASLKNALDAAADTFETLNGTEVVLSYAGSAALARQIDQGAPADLFISAHPIWMTYLVDRGLVEGTATTSVASNRLVLISTAEGALDLKNAQSLRDALGSEGRLAIGVTQAVPVGIYGKAALEQLGLWEALAVHLAETENVRAALRLVALGEAPLGIVYATDAVVEPRVSVAATFPEDSHPPITYPAARLGDSPQAQAFLEFLQGAEGQAIFASFGFLPGAAP